MSKTKKFSTLVLTLVMTIVCSMGIVTNAKASLIESESWSTTSITNPGAPASASSSPVVRMNMTPYRYELKCSKMSDTVNRSVTMTCAKTLYTSYEKNVAIGKSIVINNTGSTYWFCVNAGDYVYYNISCKSTSTYNMFASGVINNYNTH